MRTEYIPIEYVYFVVRLNARGEVVDNYDNLNSAKGRIVEEKTRDNRKFALGIIDNKPQYTVRMVRK